MERIKIALIGIGGFGNQYVNTLLTDERKSSVMITGVCDPRPEGCVHLDDLKALGIPVYSDPEELFKHSSADLAVISTPIFLHPSHASLAFRSGCDVLLEKPIAATEEAAKQIISERDKYHRKLAIGFQWCYDKSMRQFKHDAVSGRFGRLLSMKAMVLWPRGLSYYARGGGWAGKKFAADGTPVFDSVASNATAHYIMNMLFVAGNSDSGAAQLSANDIRLWRANDIETFDSIAFQGTIGEAEVLYLASHSITNEELMDPIFEYTFEKGKACFDEGKGGSILFRYDDGTIIDYGRSYPGGNNVEKLWCCVDALQNDTWSNLPCPAETAIKHNMAMDMINKEPITDLRHIRRKDETAGLWYIPGLADSFRDAYQNRRLPAIG